MFRFMISSFFICLAWSSASFGDPVEREGYSKYCLGALKAHFEYEIKNNYIDTNVKDSLIEQGVVTEGPDGELIYSNELKHPGGS